MNLLINVLATAVKIYAIRNNVPDIDTSSSRFYKDTRFWGKLALGAVELYNVTNDPKYLNDAEVYGDSAKSDYWWSWGDINSLADYRIAQHVPRFAEYIYNNLDAFNIHKEKSIFKEGMEFSWGTTNSLLGIVIQNILYKKLTGKTTFDSLASYQKDYILGRNPWGMSFIYDFRNRLSKTFSLTNSIFPQGIFAGSAYSWTRPGKFVKKL